MLVYCMGPVDRNPSAVDWIDDLWGEINGLDTPPGVVLFHPKSAFRLVDNGKVDVAQDVERVNTYVLNHSDLVVFNYMPGVESWGVPYELELVAEDPEQSLVMVIGPEAYKSLPLYLRLLLERVRNLVLCPSLQETARHIDRLYRGGYDDRFASELPF